MTNKIICSSSPRNNVGCTFLDWSILYLHGRDMFFNYKKHRLIQLVHNPITPLNAHGHEKNHPAGLDQTKQYVEAFLQFPHDLLSLYPIPMHHETAMQALGISVDQLQNPEINRIAANFINDDFVKLTDYLLDQGTKLIYVDHNLPVYNIGIRSLDKLFLEARPALSVDEIQNKFQTVFFSSSVETWTNQGLVDIWDVRERLALDTRPLQLPSKPNVDFSKPHCFIDSLEWLTTGSSTIRKVMDFCKLKINKNRWDKWIDVYNSWQAIHHKNLNFSYQLPHIIDAIINNKFFVINLTFDQEVVIQHCLIYQHNLNLKTWQLEKFPNNTQELHKLLEDNMHPLRDV